MPIANLGKIPLIKSTLIDDYASQFSVINYSVIKTF